MSFCTECGKKLDAGAKFCANCGTKVGESSDSSQITEKADKTKRHQEYVGKVLKCPNCGEAIDKLTAVCPACRYRLDNDETSHSIKALKKELLELEARRKQGPLSGLEMFTSANKVDRQIVTLIESFPTPNSVDEVLELMLLASSSINVRLSSNTLLHKINSGSAYQTGSMMLIRISDAWVAKLKQLYQRAEILFSDDPLFPKMKKIYEDKMRELKYIK